MSGLREQKKQETRRRIIESAKKLFLQHGFDHTSTEQIAKHAEIGSGTVFNYFPTKSDILIEVMKDDFIRSGDHSTPPYHMKETAEETVQSYLFNRLETISLLDKRLFREVLTASMNAYQKRPEFLSSLMELDFMFIDELVELLEELKNTNKLENQFDSSTAAEVIYSSVMYEALLFLYIEEKKISETTERIRKKIKFIFK
ncbi:TetR/AcrR family transcriptional regulator [Alkalihalobacillus sp. CinArs1]|uniref:TetR/AcrR family transcriptional regulator n=1 Tax=Alkalihalobacillus sp. CinArs1 TaxID=2995314 RepID=UPI0022DDA24F|nr:TetR/AcrR family transcriptional regulator [Alkalihalobacillus sp. CinArs1]